MNLALRTLEYWVDTLNPEYLEPAMADVMPRLMHALWSHLRPPPYPFGPKVPRPALLHSRHACKLQENFLLWHASGGTLRSADVLSCTAAEACRGYQIKQRLCR